MTIIDIEAYKVKNRFSSLCLFTCVNLYRYAAAAEMRTVFNPESFGAGGEARGSIEAGGEEGGEDEDADATAGAGDLDGDGKLSWVEFYTKLVGLQ